MKRWGVVLGLGLVAALGAATLSALGGTPGAGACAPKVTIVGGKQHTLYCGPAKATVHYGGKTITYSGGTCTNAAGFFTLYIGIRIAGGSSKHLFFAFGPVKKDGTYTQHDFVDGFQLADGAYSLHTGTTVLSGKLSKGTFAGGTIIAAGGKNRPGTRLTGSFDCG